MSITVHLGDLPYSGAITKMPNCSVVSSESAPSAHSDLFQHLEDAPTKDCDIRPIENEKQRARKTSYSEQSTNLGHKNGDSNRCASSEAVQVRLRGPALVHATSCGSLETGKSTKCSELNGQFTSPRQRSKMAKTELNSDTDTDTDFVDDVSLSSQISDSLSSFSLQDSVSSVTTSSAYYTESSTVSSDVAKSQVKGVEDNFVPIFPFRVSIFPHMPPTISFAPHDREAENLSEDLRRVLKWQLTKTTPAILKKILTNTGFKMTKQMNTWIGTWGRHLRAFEFQGFSSYQKFNHFPGTFQIGRKDRLWKNIYRLQHLHGKQDFGFIPRTFILPNDLNRLRFAWEAGGNKQRWIVKPPAAARGNGIRVVHKYAQIPKQGAFVVQRYLSKPYLIDNTKFDLRIYVYVTSFDPLRIYVFNDGLVRFASMKYSNDTRTLKDRYMHLTNSSINRNNGNYTVSANEEEWCGHKWSIKALWKYLALQEVDTDEIWENIVDIIAKTVVRDERIKMTRRSTLMKTENCVPCVSVLSHLNVKNKYSCHEVFGFDIMLDEELKPWLLEVNVSPSLHSSTSLDASIKGKMLRELLNLAGFKVPSHTSIGAREKLASKLGIDISSVCLNTALYDNFVSEEEKEKRLCYTFGARSSYLTGILENLTSSDIFHLAEAEDELSRAENFQRIFPSPVSHKYHKYFTSPQYYTNLLDAWETKYHSQRSKGRQILSVLCDERLHLRNIPYDQNESNIRAPRTKLNTVSCQLMRTCRNSATFRWRIKARTSAIHALRRIHQRRRVGSLLYVRKYEDDSN